MVKIANIKMRSVNSVGFMIDCEDNLTITNKKNM